MMGHLNGFSASGGGNFPKIFQKFKCPGGCPGGMLKLRFDWYISLSDTKPLTYRVWDMSVHLNLYVQAICSYSLIMSFLVNPNLCGTG